MKSLYTFLIILITVNISFAQDLYISNNANISIYVDGAGFTDYDATTNPNAATLFVQDDIQLAGTNSIIYLRNEAQLLQGSNVNNTGTGYLERGQRGSASLYNYNYWGSPVWSATNSFTLDDILFNGTDTNNVLGIQWSTAYDANYGTSPITMSSYWLYTYDDNAINDYDTWEPQDENSSINVGLGFTMKGSGSGPGTATQNYMFRGIPNNGTITNDVNDGNQTLVGNPFPSAIDAREFIRDNISGGSANPGTTTSITGTLLFWRQSTTVNTHYLAVYQGGYASLTLTGGVPAATFPTEIGGIGDAGSLIPGYYIPVAQGFFVDNDGDANDEPIQFKNSQRFFKKEALGVSVFLEPNEYNDNSKSVKTNSINNQIDDIQRVRLTFKTPEGANRYLLLGFTQNNEASDDFDYGYDGVNNEELPSDLNWEIDDKNYIIQGVGKFNTNKIYPLNMIVGEKGAVEIELAELENFDEEINVFVYDSYLETYTKLNTSNYFKNFDEGIYNKRFFITFSNNETLTNPSYLENSLTVFQNNTASELTIFNPNNLEITSLNIFDTAGKQVFNINNLETKSEYKFSTKNISDGVYVAKVNLNGKNTIIKKVVIKNK